MSASALIFAEFDPTGTYLAYGLIALDTHELRVQSVNSSEAGINSSFKLGKDQKLTAISWINWQRNTFIALGTSVGSIFIYSPLTNEIVQELRNPNGSEIRDVHYSSLTHSLWSCDVGDTVQEWELNGFTLKQSISLKEYVEGTDNFSKISTIKYLDKPCLLIASFSVHIYDIGSHQILHSFPTHMQPVNKVFYIHGNDDLFFTSAKDDRFINLNSVSKLRTTTVYVANSPVVDFAFLQRDGASILAAITEEGVVEVFNDPLGNKSDTNLANGASKRRKHQQIKDRSRSTDATFKLTRPKPSVKESEEEVLPVISISITDDFISYSWLENSNLAYFDKIAWRKADAFNLNSAVDIQKLKPEIIIDHSKFGHDIAAKRNYNEGNTIVTDGTNISSMQSLDESENEKDEESLAEKMENLVSDQKPKKKKSVKKLSGQNITSLATVLSQALRSNDHALLETVLSNRDPRVIQSTISKLDASLAVILLDLLAERMARQSSKFDQLNYWLKWIIIIHGGMLASVPKLNLKLAHLHAVLSKKAEALPRLLELQGRLNMLYQQKDLKQEILAGDLDEESEYSDSEVEYIEELDTELSDQDISMDYSDGDTGFDLNGDSIDLKE